MGEIILYIWEFLQISPKDSHFPDTFLKYLTTKKYIVWNMAFFVNKSEGPIYFFLPPIYWNDRILEFNNSWFQSILSSQKWFQAKENTRDGHKDAAFFYEALMSGLFWHRCAGTSCLLDLGHTHRLCMFDLSVLGYFKSATKSKNTNFHIC